MTFPACLWRSALELIGSNSRCKSLKKQFTNIYFDFEKSSKAQECICMYFYFQIIISISISIIHHSNLTEILIVQSLPAIVLPWERIVCSGISGSVL